MLFRSLYTISSIYNKLGDKEKKFSYSNQCEELFESIGYRGENYLNNLGNLSHYYDMGNIDMAFKYAFKKLRYAEDFDPQGEHAVGANIALSKLYYYSKRFEEAISLIYCVDN